ncbi:MAG: NADH-quinone oxidoreductase subunit J [Melioribacteraceae bacterium]|nr:NADH-quinone oxidoreductase subunit J [Melioribacteraceae bacterium]MCO6473402.1 NADH-quinone oxidoreductase subunit J [Melioribacteraceae bacterium]MDD3558753.1 NADH-quinone oxidoreductase subunit J [Melioribacteraceae bacterium]
MDLYDIIFYLFALLTLVSAYFVVTNKNIVHSAFFLLFTLFGIAGLYVLLGADFLAVVQIMVYVGGILILLLFGVMITNKITNVSIKTGTIHIIPAAIVIGLFAGALASIMVKTQWQTESAKIPFTTSYALGKSLITEYVLIFEILGILLLIALIGAASIARREEKE